MGSDGGAMVMDPRVNGGIDFVPQGIGADLIASLEDFSRADVDGFAARSHQRAAAAQAAGYFNKTRIAVKDLNGLTPEQFLAAVGKAFTLTHDSTATPAKPGDIRMYFAGKWHALAWQQLLAFAILLALGFLLVAALLLDGNVGGAFVCGTTGEGATLTLAERAAKTEGREQRRPRGFRRVDHHRSSRSPRCARAGPRG